ncbi:PREDICTED: uncharacterized protein LOC109221683 [Nicotiana attenuata]|uniref:uncharacterized protein LOC109221683 n=1 Tax=Nicotiana attenuata TaxID=49451 RepID=UPI000904C234|nr:PREDICTED: uncharacterized protein LOC109221683 [Nicotiana attenuata]
MSIMEELTFFLGLQIQHSEEGTFICQTKYTKELIQKFGMSNAKAIGTPMSPLTSLDKDEHGNPIDKTKYRGMIVSLLYLTASRPDIMFSVFKCAKFKSAPKESHLIAVKRIIRYIIGTVSHGLRYPRSNNFKLEGFLDADLAGDKEDTKSTSGTCQLLGKALISWNSKKQGSVALSTTEAEYIASVCEYGYMCVKGSWVKKQEGEVKHAQPDPKSKPSVSHHSPSVLDLAEKLVAIDNQLSAIKDILTATQSTVGDIHAISKETGSDVSKIRVAVLKVRENAIKAFKEVHDRLDGVTQPMPALIN